MVLDIFAAMKAVTYIIDTKKVRVTLCCENRNSFILRRRLKLREFTQEQHSHGIEVSMVFLECVANEIPALTLLLGNHLLTTHLNIFKKIP